MNRDIVYLKDILEAAKLLRQYVKGKLYDDFIGDTYFQDAVVRRCEIIGEAARRISPEFKMKYSQFPWDKMIALRNVLIHEYDDYDPYTVWETIRDDVPALIPKMIEVFREYGIDEESE